MRISVGLFILCDLGLLLLSTLCDLSNCIFLVDGDCSDCKKELFKI